MPSTMCRDYYFPMLTWCDVLQAGAVAGWPVLLFVAALLFAVNVISVYPVYFYST